MPASKLVFIIMLATIAASSIHADTSRTSNRAGAKSVSDQKALDAEYARLWALAKRRNALRSFVHQLDISDHPRIGDPSAPIAIIEFGSYQCPYCRRHLLETMPALKEAYVDTGKVLYVFFDAALDPTHTHAQAAAEAARCADAQGRYWDFRQQLFHNQKALHAAFLEGHAKAAGLNVGEFTSCLTSARYGEQIDNDSSVGRALQVRGTPAFFLGFKQGAKRVSIVRRIDGAQSFAVFAQQTDELLVAVPETKTN